MISPSGAERPAHLPIGRWLGDFAPLSEAEEKLVAACAKGEPCVLDAERPEQATAANTIRAGLIRFLALGGDAKNPLHERGVCLQGAWISEALDLKGCNVEADLVLLACHCSAPIIACSARLAGLNLSGSAINGLRADRMSVLGSVFLRNGFSARAKSACSAPSSAAIWIAPKVALQTRTAKLSTPTAARLRAIAF
ncbi:hypothetical protein ACFS32_09540 [Novosphingobium pokkalii]|uniref:hypothetical protein n=1 Tax=Novosphingobium pokkalii TaxID=1770194 RepID=UPI0036339793